MRIKVAGLKQTLLEPLQFDLDDEIAKLEKKKRALNRGSPRFNMLSKELLILKGYMPSRDRDREIDREAEERASVNQRSSAWWGGQ